MKRLNKEDIEKELATLRSLYTIPSKPEKVEKETKPKKKRKTKKPAKPKMTKAQKILNETKEKVAAEIPKYKRAKKRRRKGPRPKRAARPKAPKMPKFRSRDEDFLSAKYRVWRKAVFARDRYMCKKCGKSRYIQAHHIKTYAESPMTRYDVSNGITLCKECHKQINKKEKEWAYVCYALINPGSYMNMEIAAKQIEAEEKQCIQ